MRTLNNTKKSRIHPLSVATHLYTTLLSGSGETKGPDGLAWQPCPGHWEPFSFDKALNLEWKKL